MLGSFLITIICVERPLVTSARFYVDQVICFRPNFQNHAKVFIPEIIFFMFFSLRLQVVRKPQSADTSSSDSDGEEDKK